jgi:HAD superfamily hydrolase (TIGR01509 family)
MRRATRAAERRSEVVHVGDDMAIAATTAHVTAEPGGPRPAWLVDVDATLVDSNDHHTIAWSRALRDHGEDARLAAIHRLIGMGGRELLGELLGRDHQAIRRSWRTHFDALLPEVRAFVGAADLLRALHCRGSQVVLATSSPGDLLEHMRSLVGADDAIDEVVSADDVDRAKPAPDVFQAALERAGIAPEHAMVLGDSVWDVRAAGKAGIACVGLESGGFSRCELLDEGAALVYADPGDLLAHLDDVASAAAFAPADRNRA